MQQDYPCSYEEFRSVVLEAVNSCSQLADLNRRTADVAEKRFPPAAEPSGTYGVRSVSYFSGDSSGLSPRDRARVQSIFWDLIVEGILRPGCNDGSNNNLPFFHVTERGTQVIAEGSASPYDPDGYLKRLSLDVPNLDPVVMIYLIEALSTFRIGCLLSSTIVLGCASEKLLLLLIEAYASALPEERQAKFRKDTTGRMIKRQFEEFQRHFESTIKPKLPGDLKDTLDIHVSGIFTLFRNMRNDAGHPTGKTIDRQEANANLILFPMYTRHVYKLIDWLTANPFQ